MISLRDYQQTAVDRIRASLTTNRAPLFVAPTGAGKCLGRGTPVLMFDGTIKPVEHVIVGDFLMGPDSVARRVASTCSGREALYRVCPTKGDSFVVNESHILSLKMTPSGDGAKCGSEFYSDGDIVNVSVANYLQTSATFRHRAKAWRAPIDFPAQEFPQDLPPYLLGVWLGDGHARNGGISGMDHEVVSEIGNYAAAHGMYVRTEEVEGKCPNYFITRGRHWPGRGHRTNPFLRALHKLGLLRNKHIPHVYLSNSRHVRLEVLAGLIDTDGSLSNGGYDFISKEERLSDGVCFLARSLGLAAYKKACKKTCTNNGAVGDYFRVSISGDCSIIPCRIRRKKPLPRRQKKSVLVTGFKLEPIGDGEYFGFEIEGPDRLFLLGDFTVTHNTILFSYIAHAASQKGNRVTIGAHRFELLAQISLALGRFGVSHGIIAPGITPNPHALVQVAGTAALASRLKKSSFRIPTDLLVLDEAHHVQPTNTWGRIYEGLGKPPMLGVTASPIRSDGKGLGINCGGLFDDMIEVISTAELIEQGYLVEPIVYAPAERLDLSGLRSRGGDYEREALAERIDKPTITGNAVDHYRRICPGLTAVAFGVSIEHCVHIAREFTAAGYRFEVIDGSMDATYRKRLIAGLGKEITGLVSCDLIGEGVDIPAIGCAIMMRPTQSLGLHIQQMGRALRPIYADGFDLSTTAGRFAGLAAAGKTHAYILDHVGNSLVHGLPQTPREWSLDGIQKKKKKKNDEPTLPVKQCESCYAVYQPPGPVCPMCGHVHPVDSRQIEQVEGELRQITKEEAAALAKQKKREIQSARTKEALEAIAKQRGYSEKWADHIWAARQRAADARMANQIQFFGRN